MFVNTRYLKYKVLNWSQKRVAKNCFSHRGFMKKFRRINYPNNLHNLPKFGISISQKLPKDPYLILNVDRDTDLKEVKKMYFKLAKKYHPDLNKGNEHANKMFIVSKYLCLYSLLRSNNKVVYLTITTLSFYTHLIFFSL